MPSYLSIVILGAAAHHARGRHVPVAVHVLVHLHGPELSGVHAVLHLLRLLLLHDLRPELRLTSGRELPRPHRVGGLHGLPGGRVLSRLQVPARRILLTGAAQHGTHLGAGHVQVGVHSHNNHGSTTTT